jgi:hypothetical protein
VFARGHAFAAIIAPDAGVDLVFGESGELVAAPFASDGHVPWVRRTARNPATSGAGNQASGVQLAATRRWPSRCLGPDPARL